MSIRPAFQFYPADWRNNAKLRRCSEGARGAWMDILCLLHDSDEYGVLRWSLADIARAAGVKLKYAQELSTKNVLKGSDDKFTSYIFTPFHAGKHGEPVTLIAEQQGPLWFCSRFVKDEYLRQNRGAKTRFTAESQPSPSRRQGERHGDGSSSSTSSSSSEVERKKETSVSRHLETTPVAASPPRPPPPPSDGLAAHTPQGQMNATDFALWRQASKLTIPRGWSPTKALQAWLAMPYIPPETMVDIWAAYVDDCKQISSTQRFPQRVMHPENWFRERRYEGYLNDIRAKEITSINRMSERSVTLQQWEQHGAAVLARIGQDQFDAWLIGSKLTIVQPAKAILEIPKPFIAKWLQDHPGIIRHIEAVTGAKVEITQPQRQTA